MNGRMQMTVLSDLSANIFAVCLLVLLILLAEAANRPPAASLTGEQVEVSSDLVAVERRPLSGGEMVAELYDRRLATPAFAIDLRAGGVTLVSGGAERALPLAGLRPTLATLLRQVPPDMPVRLYVFSPQAYADVVAALGSAGRPFLEMSVPLALRNRVGDGWSDGFLALAEVPSSLDDFRAGLARLVSGGTAPRSGGAMDEAGGAPATGFGASLLERFTAWLRGVFDILVPLAALAAIVFVERRHPRPTARTLLNRRETLSSPATE
jgi:hypothetical protein